MFRPYFIIGIASAILGFALSYFTKAFPSWRKFSEGPLPFIIIILALTSYPPLMLFDISRGGILLAILLILQNAAGLTGIILLSWSTAELLYGRLNLPKRFPPLNTKRDFSFTAVLYGIPIYAVSYFVFGAHPHVGDGVIQLLQAKIYLTGSFTMPALQPIEFFFDPFLAVKGGEMFAQYPPGYSLLLALGLLAGKPEFVNPILTGLTLILFLKLLKEMGLSRWYGLLFALSPFVIFMSGSFMNHISAMFLGALGLYAFIKSKREHSGLLLIWGLSAGLMFSTRPFTALCFNLPLLISLLRRRVGLGVLLAGVGFVIGASLFFIYNYFTSGSLFEVGYAAAWDGRSGLFFGDPPWGPRHTPQMGLAHLGVLLYGLNTQLFMIPLPALTGAALWILFKKDKGWKEWILFSSGITGFAGYYFYFYVDLVLGPRFAYESAFPLLLITAGGLKALYRHLRERGMPADKVKWSFITGGLLLFLCWITISMPFKLKSYADRYYDVENDFISQFEKYNIHNAVIFLDDFPSTDRHARFFSLGFSSRQAWYYANRLSDQAAASALYNLGIDPDEGYGRVVDINLLGVELNRYWTNPKSRPSPQEDEEQQYIPLTQGLLYMSPPLEENDIIFARDLGKHDLKLMEVFPERDFYRLMRDESGWLLRKIERN
ncbi:MAG: hypothetical protein H8E87_07215 [FCB group bacterium]|nr:hypothetical protein [FCB group bacterium]